MALTSTQLQTLRTDITVTRASTTYQGQTLLQWWNAGADGLLAQFYNQTASPVVLLWNPRVNTQSMVDAMVGTEYTAAGLANRELLQLITRSAIIDATLPQVRANFATAIGGGSTTVTNWTALARKNATYLEALLVTNAAGGASVTAQFGYTISPDDVSQARNA
jgi:hypothetical protein